VLYPCALVALAQFILILEMLIFSKIFFSKIIFNKENEKSFEIFEIFLKL
jgi:hypothetical protein